MHRPVDDVKPFEGAFLWALTFYLATFVFEGPLRYGLAVAGAGSLLYLRDVLMVILIAMGIGMQWKDTGRLPMMLVAILWLLVVHTFIGALKQGSVFQAFFGLKIFLAFAVGIALAPTFERKSDYFYRLLAFFYVCSVIAVFTNVVVGAFPWEGLEYETAFGNVTATREWWAGGVRRVPGVARASFDAAVVIGVSGIMLIAFTPRVLVKLLVAVSGLLAIGFTTSKGMIAAYALASAWLFLARNSTGRRRGAILVAGVAVFCFLLPIISGFFYPFNHNSARHIPGILMSFWARIVDMWPNSFFVIDSVSGLFLGEGIGSIGVPMKYGMEYRRYMAADNVFVYCLVTFGMLAIPYLFLPVIRLFAGELSEKRLQDFIVAMLIVTFTYGVFVNMVEQPFFLITFGVVVGLLFSGRRTAHG